MALDGTVSLSIAIDWRRELMLVVAGDGALADLSGETSDGVGHFVVVIAGWTERGYV